MMNKETNNWNPILLSELKELIDIGISKMTDSQILIWNQIKIVPEKWEEDINGKEDNGFWVIAIDNNEVIWYNDIEEGFNISNFTKRGKINNYYSEQDELQWALNKLKRH